MQDQYSYSESEGMSSFGVTELDLEQDSDLLSLFQHVKDMEGIEVSQNRHLLKSLQSNIKIKDPRNSNENQQKVEHNDSTIELMKGYYSQCQVESEGNIKRKYKKTKVINKNQRKDKRKRLKTYIEMLQNRCTQLTLELDKLKKLNKINKQYMKKLNDSQQLINGFFVGKQQIYDKLQTIVSQKNAENQKKKILISHHQCFKKQKMDKTLSQSNTMFSYNQHEQKILEVISALRMRLGVFGTDRIKNINYYFKQLIDMMLPDAQKYISLTAFNQTDIFSKKFVQRRQYDHNVEQWRRQMIDNMNLTNQQIQFIQYLKQNLLQQKKKFDKLLIHFYQIKCQLTKQARNMEETSDQIHTKMSPIQIAQTLLYIEKYRYQKGIFQTNDSTRLIFQKLQKDQYYYDKNDPFSLQKKTFS